MRTKTKFKYGSAQVWLNRLLVGEFKREDGSCILDWPFARDGNGYPNIRRSGNSAGVHKIILEHFLERRLLPGMVASP